MDTPYPDGKRRATSAAPPRPHRDGRPRTSRARQAGEGA